jgi:hypothetical protein
MSDYWIQLRCKASSIQYLVGWKWFIGFMIFYRHMLAQGDKVHWHDAAQQKALQFVVWLKPWLFIQTA